MNFPQTISSFFSYRTEKKLFLHLPGKRDEHLLRRALFSATSNFRRRRRLPRPIERTRKLRKSVRCGCGRIEQVRGNLPRLAGGAALGLSPDPPGTGRGRRSDSRLRAAGAAARPRTCRGLRRPASSADSSATQAAALSSGRSSPQDFPTDCGNESGLGLRTWKIPETSLHSHSTV